MLLLFQLWVVTIAEHMSPSNKNTSCYPLSSCYNNAVILVDFNATSETRAFPSIYELVKNV